MEIRAIDLLADAALIEDLARRVTGQPGLTVLSEGKVVAIETGAAGGFICVVGDEPVAAAVTAPAAPGERAVEILDGGRLGEPGLVDLLGAVIDQAKAGDMSSIRLWAYGGASVDAAELMGFELERTLLRMGRRLPAEGPHFPPHIEIAAFQPGRDDAAFLAVNNLAFSGHPENGSWTADDLGPRLRAPWFSAEGFRLAWDRRDGELAGFCWTKQHGHGEGEIYVIAAAPGYQGQGLGRQLVLEGMRHLHSVGADEVFLYTEGDNDRAVSMYLGLGYAVQTTSRAWLLSL